MKRFNINEFLWFLILAGFAVFTAYLITSGKIAMFIHPKMHVYMILSFIGFSQLAIYQFNKAFTFPKKEKLKLGYSLFALTLAAGFFAAPRGLNAEAIQNKGITVTAPVNTAGDTGAAPKNQLKLPETSDVIILNDNNYIAYLNDLGANMEGYTGKKIILSGFIYKEKSFAKDQFAAARMVMSCCAADSQLIGLLCKWPEAEGLKSEEWVEVEGIIGSAIYKDEKSGQEIEMPSVTVTRLEKISAPANPYLYP